MRQSVRLSLPFVDAAGNRTSVIDDSGNMYHAGNCYYCHNRENRLIPVTKPVPPTEQLNNSAAYAKGGDAP